MNEQSLPSRTLERAVGELAKLPGIGRKSAIRLALHILAKGPEFGLSLAESIHSLATETKQCQRCHNISESDICQICADERRDSTRICVVEDVRDVLAIENTGQFKGYYHVLGGVINPMAGVGPQDLYVADLPERVEKTGCEEVIVALPATAEGDTTAFYVYKKLKHLPITISALARGVAIGEELEYADEITLGRSILNRVPFENSLKI
ncbi:recombination mediator RecR [Schleiferia thermophila]|jgi:recombination protein RecR|uniref:Recombination protein RecR n=1 Tax=Schleiferia thermophila TaxID=884107 RepID=A0A369AA21_9FLAO|nr:recombination mediator RecR [Schleiferia thermophila]KFD38560.1 recombinase RecR [Schleiferia thermophila str. Yellowstone]RCX05146.1 DNA replication and repair protein RecR [Schleiferia thermophila]GCD79338.1 recombination protein RecR [Schleiferia thermophila]